MELAAEKRDGLETHRFTGVLHLTDAQVLQGDDPPWLLVLVRGRGKTCGIRGDSSALGTPHH